jgi:adenosylmethionine-8-amino-7-oxononanoate aminotransferase
MPTLKQRDRDTVWHPYTPMKIWPEAIAIIRGEGVYLYDEDGKKFIDAISSWWVNLHGHSHPYIAQKVSEQLLSLEHCIFAGFTHAPAIALAERLLKIVPGKLSRVFYSDNGSTAVEVAIKMALQYWSNKNNRQRTRLIALESAYHGDTFGAMSVSSRSGFNEAFGSFLFDVDRIPFPSPSKKEESLFQLEQLLRKETTAALIIEPLIQGAAGMHMYSPTVLESFFKLCRQYGALIIADEVMTGFGRTGKLFACDYVQTSPDIVCLSKGLTGGTLPLGVTACSEPVYRAFYDDDRTKTLYHGHSYTANPLACAAGLASLDASRLTIAQQHAGFWQKIKGHPKVADARFLGTILALELDLGKSDYNHAQRDDIYRYFIDRGILIRPLGNIIYVLPPYCITTEQLREVYDGIAGLLNKL